MTYHSVLDAKPPVSSEVVVTPVPQEFLADEFIMNGPMVARAAKTSEGRYESSDLFDACWHNQMLMWVAVRMYSDRRRKTLGVLFTGINIYPRMKTFCLRYASGTELKEWASTAHTAMLTAAKEEGCERLESICRPGWGRFLRKYDIKPKAILLEMRVS